MLSYILYNKKHIFAKLELGENLSMDRIFLNENSENNENNRGDKKSPPKKSFDFKLYKKNTLNSLNDVEHFLNTFQHNLKYFKLFKILK